LASERVDDLQSDGDIDDAALAGGRDPALVEAQSDFEVPPVSRRAK
jgi:hypothetical protein